MDLREKTANLFRHPWELSRADCIFNLIRKGSSADSFFDIGAGDRFFTLKLKNLTGGDIYAVDSGYPDGEEYVEGIRCVKSISSLPPTGEGVIMMDVLEHIEDDASFLRQVLAKTVRGGKVYVTVPAFQFLFSGHDVFLKHFRRYSRKRLGELLASAGLSVESCHYFYCSLFFVRLLTMKMRHETGIGGWKYSERHFATRAIRAMLSFDFAVCRLLSKCHIYLPGLSLAAVCKKEVETDA